MELTLIRGDTYTLTFELTDVHGNPYVLTEKDKCYFTVKKDYAHKDFVLQKRFGDGITYNEETGQYEIRLPQASTCDLACGWYVFDIKCVIANVDDVDNNFVKTLIKGALLLENNATHKGNE